MKIFTTPRFEKRLRLFIDTHPEVENAARQKMEKIASNPFSISLGTHKLSGPLKRCFAAKITRSYRIVFTINKDELCFIDIGSHDEVY